MIKLTFYDGVTPLLSELAVRHPMFAREALQAAGYKLMRGIRYEMRTETTQWESIWRNGKRSTRLTRRTFRLGRRFSDRTGDELKPSNMENFIHYYMSPANPTFVAVGGAHPDFIPLRIRDGEVVGTMSKLSKVGKQGAAILHKLNTGRITPEHPYYKQSWIPNANYPHRGFYERAFYGSKSELEDTVVKRFEKAFHNTVNNLQTKVIKRSYAS